MWVCHRHHGWRYRRFWVTLPGIVIYITKMFITCSKRMRAINFGSPYCCSKNLNRKSYPLLGYGAKFVIIYFCVCCCYSTKWSLKWFTYRMCFVWEKLFAHVTRITRKFVVCCFSWKSLFHSFDFSLWPKADLDVCDGERQCKYRSSFNFLLYTKYFIKKRIIGLCC